MFEIRNERSVFKLFAKGEPGLTKTSISMMARGVVVDRRRTWNIPAGRRLLINYLLNAGLSRISWHIH